MPESPIKKAYNALHQRPLGKRLFSAAVSLKAPYFRTILPTVVSLEAGRGEVRIPDWWGVHNHLGTVHAIACCNLAELAGGTTLDMSLPDTHRWIPKGMQVSYLKKAKGTLTAVATVEDLSSLTVDEAREVVVPIDITDPKGTTVVHADITMWVSPRRASGDPRGRVVA
jgi:acyl-coenzyme A thioesterase PaaI-like protein